MSNEKIEIPICFYTNNNGDKVYDLEGMAEHFENKLNELLDGVSDYTQCVVMCSVEEHTDD